MLKPGGGSGIMSVTMRDKSVLYSAYMPFVEHGGLFIATNKKFKMGDEVFLLLNLMDEAEKIPVAGTIIWVTPKGAQGGRASGIGVQFDSKNKMAHDKIETYLAGALNSDKSTQTM
jgi:type IV pilus assembly protein PilZ